MHKVFINKSFLIIAGAFKISKEWYQYINISNLDYVYTYERAFCALIFVVNGLLYAWRSVGHHVGLFKLKNEIYQFQTIVFYYVNV